MLIKNYPVFYELFKEKNNCKGSISSLSGSKITVSGKIYPGVKMIIDGYFNNIASKDESLTTLNTAFAKEGAYINVPKSKVVEKPIENRIEREVIYEKFIENPIERIIERPVEKIIRKTVEVLVEKPVVVEEYVDKIIENRIENRYDVVREQIVNEHVQIDVHKERTILKPFRNEIQVKEIVKDMPVYQDIIVERPYETIVRREVEQQYDVLFPDQSERTKREN